ncbi:MAG: transporter [Acidobacteriota bacterium]
MRRAGLLFFLLSALPAAGKAQQPFVTDDADVTPRREFHFEYYNEYVALSQSASPDLRQDTSNFVIQYGLFNGFEVNVDLPLISIERSRESSIGSAFGLGDIDFAFKWRLVPEDGARPAFTLSGAVEVPTGDRASQLGSGFTDYSVNTVVQKTFWETTVVHVNGGLQFSGDTLTGAIGIRTPGRIWTAGASAAHDVSKTLRLGIDFNGAQIRTAGIIQRQLQLTAGGNYLLNEKMSIDFALLTGWSNSPRAGVLLGVSITP